MIHYSEFAARRASRLPLLGAIASLAAIAVCLGDPQAGVGMASAAQIPALNEPVIVAPERWNDEISLRLRKSSEPPQLGNLQGSAAAPQIAVALFNRERAAAGLALLSESPKLDAIASTRAQQMVMDGLTHLRPGSVLMAATDLLHQNGVSYTWNGENIFWAGGPPFDGALSDAEAWWMKSAEHRDNILGPHFRQVGIGTAIDDGKMYISAVFTD
jgi:uncharacterized protein YkwD